MELKRPPREAAVVPGKVCVRAGCSAIAAESGLPGRPKASVIRRAGRRERATLLASAPRARAKSGDSHSNPRRRQPSRLACAARTAASGAISSPGPVIHFAGKRLPRAK